MRNSNRTTFVAVAILATFWIAIVGNCNAQTTRTVCSSACDFTTIQSAIDASAAGDIIQVSAGNYSDSGITIDKSLTLRGAKYGQDARQRGNKTNTPTGETVLTSNAGPFLFKPTASNITIDGFWFQNLGVRGIDNYSSSVDNLTIQNNVFFVNSSTNSQGVGNIQLEGGGPTANYFDFENNYATMNLSTEVSGSGQAYFLLMEATMDHGTVRNNYINVDNVAFGPFGTSTGWKIDSNEFDGTLSTLGDYWGFGFNANLGDVAITNNNVHKMYVGLGQISVVDGSITGNTFNDNYAAAFQLWGGEYGTVVSSNVTIENDLVIYNGATCTGFADASHGLRLRPGLDPTTIHFHSNNFQDLGVGTCGQAWAIRNSASPGLADAVYNSWGQSDGPATAQTDTYETTDPYISGSTPDPNKTGQLGFWPLVTTSTTITSPTSGQGGNVDAGYTVAGTVAVTGIGTSAPDGFDPNQLPGVAGSMLPGQVGVSDGTDSCTSGSLSLSDGKFDFSCSLTSTTGGAKTLTAAYSDTSAVPYYNASSGTVTPYNVKSAPTVTQWPTASAINFGQSLQHSSLSGGLATPSGNFTFTSPDTVPSSAGTYGASVTFTPADTADYSTVTNTVNLTVNQATTTISISNVPINAVDNGSFTPAYAYTGDGIPSVTSNSLSICTVSGSTVNFVGIGNCSLTASATAGTNYAAVTGSAQSFIIGRATPTISINNIPANPVYKGSFTPTYAYVGDGRPSFVTNSPLICKVSFGVVNFVAVGNCSLTASATAGTEDAAVTGSAQIFAVSRATQATLTLKVTSPATYGSSQLLAATGGSGTGAISYSADHTDVCSISANKLTMSSGAGSCTVTATKAADTNYLQATATAPITARPATATISISNLPKSGAYGAQFTAQFKYTADGTPSVASSTAACSVSGGTLVTFVHQGTCTLTASAPATTNYNAAIGTAQSFTVGKASPNLTLASAKNPSTYGDSVGFITATLSATPGLYPSGSVSFFDGATNLGSQTLVNGSATLNVSKLNVGSHYITATYAGDTNYISAKSNAVTQTVIKANPTVNLVPSPNPSTYGSPVTLSAIVTGPGALSPTGAVTFLDGVTVLGSARVSSGVATFSTSALKVGSHTITANYSGDADYNPGNKNAAQSVSKATPTLALATSAATVTAGTNVTFTATLPSTATGSVMFYDSATLIGTAALNKGTAKYTTRTLAKGTHSISAAYGGDTNYASTTSGTVIETVK